MEAYYALQNPSTNTPSTNTHSTNTTVSAKKPWVEKYRPHSMNDIVSQEQVVGVLKKTLGSNNLPHLLFYGPPGTGKTSTILALAQELYGPTMIKSRVLELNASDERGISAVRDRIKNFSRSAVSSASNGYPCPPFKILILDEADMMTKDAQFALRRIMETYSKTTRFCIICNYISRIIEPITSRCAKFRFKDLPVNHVKERIDSISKAENVLLGDGTLDALVNASRGDLRKAITFLQSGSNIHLQNPITPNTVYEMAGIIPEDIFRSLVHAWQSMDINDVTIAVQSIVNNGSSVESVISQIMDEILKSETLDTIKKSKISQVLGEVDFRLAQGADEHIQILYLVSEIRAIVIGP
ncbi:replication factor C subunit 2 [Spinellus fusiger]|nr:replication factor C subunit 2 [Spinellus fusiger]